MSGKFGNYRNKDITTITISLETRETLRQLQGKYHLEVNDAMQLLLYIYEQIGKEYDIVVYGDLHIPPPQETFNSFSYSEIQKDHDENGID